MEATPTARPARRRPGRRTHAVATTTCRRTRLDDAMLRARARRRADVARAPPAPAAHDHLDRRPARDHRRLRRASTASSSRPCPGSSSRPTRRSSCWPSSSSTSASRCAASAGRSSCAGPACAIGTKDSTEIIFLSWLVNCVVPAKLGDVYRAYLLKINSTASLSRTFGTVFIERVLDLFAIALLGLAAGFWSFRDGLPPAIQVVFGDRRRRGRRRSPSACSRCATSGGGSSSRCRPAAPGPRAVRPVRGGRVRGARRCASCPSSAVLTGAHLDDRGAAPVPRRPGARLRRRLARAVGRGLRRAHRLAADGRAAQPGRPRHRRGGRRRRPARGLRRAAARGDRDRPARPGHQRVLDHRLRLDRLRRLGQAARPGARSRGPSTARRGRSHPPDRRRRGRDGLRRECRHAPATPPPRPVLHPCRHRGVPSSWRAPLGSPRRTVARPHPSRPLRSAARARPTGTNGGYSPVPRPPHHRGIEAPIERDPAARGQAARSAQAA